MTVVSSFPYPVAGVAASVLATNSANDGGEGDYRTRRFLLKNITATAPIFLGGSGVTTTNGFQWDVADGPFEFELEPGESLYGIVAATSQTVHALRAGR